MERFSLIGLQILCFLWKSFHKQKLSIIAGTRITDKDNISLLINKITGKTIINNAFIDRRLERKIKILDVFMGR